MFTFADADGHLPLLNSGRHGFDAAGCGAQVSTPEALAEKSSRR
jgi:hypothetical protein